MEKMKYAVIACFCLILSSLGEVTTAENNTQVKPIVSFTEGLAVLDAASAHSFRATDNSFYHYTPSDHSQDQAIVGGFVGAEITLNPNFSWQSGVAYYYSSPAAIQGVLQQGLDIPSQDFFNYYYSIISQQLLFQNKLIYHSEHSIHPYATFGIGAAFNTFTEYRVDNLAFLTFSPHYTDHTTTSLTYQLGVGVDVDLKDSVRVGAGYRFSDLGKSNSGQGMIDTVGFDHSLEKSHLYTHAVLVDLTFIF